MASNIDITKPTTGTATTQSVRDNFSAAKNELDALLGGRVNLLRNGDFRVSQRGTNFTVASTPANNDDTYLLDGWILLSDGNDVVNVYQHLAATIGDYASILLTVQTTQKKFGICQIIEQKDLQGIIGGSSVVSLSFKALVSDATKLDNIKAAVLSWDGTADSPTSDVVSAWNAADTTPTWATNWTEENAPANLSVGETEGTYKIENISIDTASVANLAVVIWSDAVADNDTASEKLYITDVQLQGGAVATDFDRRPFAEELARCQRYFEKSYNFGSAPGAGGTGSYDLITASGTSGRLEARFVVSKRTSPTVTWYSPSTGDSGKVRDNTAGADVAVSGAAGLGENGVIAQFSSIDQREYIGHWTADAEL